MQAPETIALDKTQTAKRLGLAPNTVSKLLESGQLRGRKVGSRWIISARAIAEFLGDLPNKTASHDAA